MSPDSPKTSDECDQSMRVAVETFSASQLTLGPLCTDSLMKGDHYTCTYQIVRKPGYKTAAVFPHSPQHLITPKFSPRTKDKLADTSSSSSHIPTLAGKPLTGTVEKSVTFSCAQASDIEIFRRGLEEALEEGCRQRCAYEITDLAFNKSKTTLTLTYVFNPLPPK